MTLGEKPQVEVQRLSECIVNEFLYVAPSIFDHLEGFEEMKRREIIKEYFQLKIKGTKCEEVKSSGDRVAYYTIQAPTIDEVREKDQQANRNLRVVDVEGNDVLRHDLIAVY